MLDHPEERLERRRIGVGEADAEQIEVHRVRQMTLREQLGGTQIEQCRPRWRRPRACRQFARTDQKLRVCVALRILHHQIHAIGRAELGFSHCLTRDVRRPSSSSTRPSSRSLARWARTVSSATGRQRGRQISVHRCGDRRHRVGPALQRLEDLPLALGAVRAVARDQRERVLDHGAVRRQRDGWPDRLDARQRLQVGSRGCHRGTPESRQCRPRRAGRR